MNKFKKFVNVASFSLLALISASNITLASSEKYILENEVKIYTNSYNAKDNKDSVGTYGKGEYLIFSKYNGMVNITKTVNVPGAWINPKSNKQKDDQESELSAIQIGEDKIRLLVQEKGYMNAYNALKYVDPVSTLDPDDYYVYKTYNGLVNLTKDKGYPGSWVNINDNNKDVVFTYSDEEEVVKEEIKSSKKKDEEVNEVADSAKDVEVQTTSSSNSSSALYSLDEFMFRGVVYWNNKKFTYYSQSVLPGGGLRIPGRHVNKDGYVADENGYIVLASDKAKGTVIDTPFGYQGKVYDSGVTGNHYDVYIK